ncbi:MAG: hypothetical protein U0166_04345 [Acidobacteriota bacterium]
MAKRGISFAFLTMLSVTTIRHARPSWSIVGLLLTIWTPGAQRFASPREDLRASVRQAFPARRPSAGTVIGWC